MGNMLTDDRFPKDRVFISGSYNNEYARVVARAISLNRVIFVRHKHIYQKVCDYQGGKYSVPRGGPARDP